MPHSNRCVVVLLGLSLVGSSLWVTPAFAKPSGKGRSIQSETGVVPNSRRETHSQITDQTSFLPPGIQKRVLRGKGLPPGIAKKVVLPKTVNTSPKSANP